MREGTREMHGREGWTDSERIAAVSAASLQLALVLIMWQTERVAFHWGLIPFILYLGMAGDPKVSLVSLILPDAPPEGAPPPGAGGMM